MSAKENAKEEEAADAIEGKRRKKRPRNCMSEEGKVAGRIKTGRDPANRPQSKQAGQRFLSKQMQPRKSAIWKAA